MNWIYRVRPITAMLVFILMLTGEATAADVTRLSGADLRPDAFAVGAYGMVHYQKTDGEWDYFAGYIDAASEESITLRQSQLHRRAIPLQRTHSALIGPTRKDVEAEADRWRRANLAEQLDLPLDTEASLAFLPTSAAVMAAHREVQNNQLPISLLADPDYIRGRFFGHKQAGRAAGSSFKLGMLSGAVGSLASTLILLNDILDGNSKTGWKMAGANAGGLVLPLLITATIPPQPDMLTPPSYPLGYRTAFNAQRGHLLKNAGGGWLLGAAAGLLASALYLSADIIE